MRWEGEGKRREGEADPEKFPAAACWFEYEDLHLASGEGKRGRGVGGPRSFSA